MIIILGSKKGNLFAEGLTVVIILIVFSLAIFFMQFINTEINTEIQGDSTMSNISKEVMQDVQNRYPVWMDGAVVFLLLMLWIFVLVAAFFVDAHPVFALFTLILIVFILIVAAILSNTFVETVSDPDLVSLQTDFAKTYWIITHLVQIIFIILGSGAVVLYGKNRE